MVLLVDNRTTGRQVAGIAVALMASLLATGAEPVTRGELLFIGTWGAVPDDPPGSRHGIFAARLDRNTGHLTPLGWVADLNHSAWLVHHPELPVLYAVGIEGTQLNVESRLVSYRINNVDGSLRELNRVGAGGINTAHVALESRSATLFASNYGSGSVTAVPILKDGSLGSVVSTQKDYGTGPAPRQAAPHAHSVAFDPAHRYMLSADFGADRLFVYRFEPRTRVLSPGDPPFVALPAGSGPRHLAFHPNGRFVYLVSELTAMVDVFRWNAASGTLEPVQSWSPYAAGVAADRSGAEIGLARDGRFLYLTLRGDADSVVVLAVDPRRGTLSEVQRTPSLGKMPWSFALDPSGRWMVVPNTGSGTVNVFGVDPASGRLTPTSESIPLPTPVAVLFAIR